MKSRYLVKKYYFILIHVIYAFASATESSYIQKLEDLRKYNKNQYYIELNNFFENADTSDLESFFDHIKSSDILSSELAFDLEEIIPFNLKTLDINNTNNTYAKLSDYIINNTTSLSHVDTIEHLALKIKTEINTVKIISQMSNQQKLKYILAQTNNLNEETNTDLELNLLNINYILFFTEDKDYVLLKSYLDQLDESMYFEALDIAFKALQYERFDLFLKIIEYKADIVEKLIQYLCYSFDSKSFDKAIAIDREKNSNTILNMKKKLEEIYNANSSNKLSNVSCPSGNLFIDLFNQKLKPKGNLKEFDSAQFDTDKTIKNWDDSYNNIVFIIETWHSKECSSESIKKFEEDNIKANQDEIIELINTNKFKYNSNGKSSGVFSTYFSSSANCHHEINMRVKP